MFTVQRGSLNLTSATSGTISISAVDTAHSFIIAKTRATSSTNAIDASVSVRFTTTGSSISSLSWVKGGTATDVTLEWQVVSSPDIDVQHFYATLTNGSNTLNQAISTVDTSKTFILGSVDTAVNNASPQRYIPNFDITSTTNARITRFVTNDDINIAFHVVEFTDSTTVQRIGGNIANTQTTFSPTITAVDLSRSFIVGHYAPTNAQNANAAMYSFGSTTQVNVVRTGTAGTMAVVGFVVQLPSGFVTQSHAISGVSNPTAQTITAVGSTANTFTLATNTATGTGSNLDRRFITTSLSTTTNVNVHLGDTTDNVDAVLFVVEYSLQAETADVDPVSSSFSVVNTTATYESVQTATVAPVSSTFSIPNVTATYQSMQTASVASVTALFSIVATTATFLSLWTAGAAPVTANLSTVDPTATYEQINTATVEPVVSSFSVVDPTATYQAATNMAFSNLRKITIDSSKVGGATHTGFVLVVSGTYAGAGTDPDLRTVGNGGGVESANGYDIAFFSDEALTTALDFELVKYVASTGEVIFWVKVPSVSHSADTEIYIAYGDSGITTNQSTPTDVWSDYNQVLHLEENVAYGTAGYIDKSPTGKNGTNQSGTFGVQGPEQIAGKIGNGQELENTGNERIYFGTGNYMDSSVKAMSAWISHNLSGNGTIWGQGSQSNNTWRFQIQNVGGSYYVGLYCRGLLTCYGDTALSADTLYRVTIATDGSTLKMYVNGVAQSLTFSAGSNGGQFPNDITWSSTIHSYIGLGYRWGAQEEFFHGIVDEFVALDYEPTASRLLAEYNNQNSPSTFYSFEEVDGGGEEATVEPVTGVLSVIDPTASYIQVETASVASVSGTLSVIDPTATFLEVSNADVDPLALQLTPIVPTATYIQVETATVEPIAGTLSVVDTTANYQETASAIVEPIIASFTVIDPTAAYGEDINAQVEPITVTLSVPEVTATYQGTLSATVEPISVTLSVVDVGGEFHVSAAVEPLSLTVSIPDVTGESDAIQTASVDPVVSTLSVVGVAATYIEIDTAQLVPVTGTLSVVSTTATHSTEYTASVSAISITLSVVNVTATSSTEYVTDVEPVSIVLSIVTTQPTYIYVATASVQPLTIQISAVPIYAQTNIFLGPIQVSGRVRLGNVSGIVRSMTHEGSVNSKSVSGQNRSKNISAVNKAIVIE